MVMTALIAKVKPISSSKVEKVKFARKSDSTSSSLRVKWFFVVGAISAGTREGEGAVVRAGGEGVVGRSPFSEAAVGHGVGLTVVGVHVSPPRPSSDPRPSSVPSSSSPPSSPSIPGIQLASAGVGATVVVVQVSPPLPGVLLPLVDLVLTGTLSSEAASAKGGVSPPVSPGGATSARVDLNDVTITLWAVNLKARKSPYAKKYMGILLSVRPTLRPRIPDTLICEGEREAKR